MTKRQPLPRAGISDAEREEIEATKRELMPEAKPAAVKQAAPAWTTDAVRTSFALPREAWTAIKQKIATDPELSMQSVILSALKDAGYPIPDDAVVRQPTRSKA